MHFLNYIIALNTTKQNLKYFRMHKHLYYVLLSDIKIQNKVIFLPLKEIA